MSLETLLEAAKYIEYRSEAKARGETPKDYNTFVSYSSSSSDNNGGSVFVQPSYSSSNNDDNSPSYYDNDTKDRRRSGGAGTREVHNKLEKNRRAHLKKCFETLKKQIPISDDKKTSNLGVLRSAFRYIQALKRKERDFEFEEERLAREKVALTQRLIILRRDMSLCMQDHMEPVEIIPLKRDREPDHDSNSNSTSTASECGPLSDVEDDKISDEVSQESVAATTAESTVDDKDTKDAVVADIKPQSDANKHKSLTLLAKSAEVISLASVKAEVPQPKAAPPKASPPKSAPVAIRAIQPHVNTLVANGEATAIKTEPQAGTGIRALSQRTAIPAQAKTVSQGTFATNGSVQTVRILAPVASTTPTKTLAMATSSSTTLTSTRVALAATGAVGSTVPITALALSKGVPAIKRVAALAPMQASTTTKGVLTTGPAPGSIAISQLAVKSNNGTQQPILTATAVNFQATTPIAASSPSAPATTVARQLVTATMKPPVARSQVAQLTQMMAPTTIVSTVGPVIPGGTSMSPIVTPMSMMSSMNRTGVAQVISSSQLGKVMTAPFIKTVPIYQQQLFPHLGAVSSQALVNPIVMVTTPNVVPATTASQVTLPGSR